LISIYICVSADHHIVDLAEATKKSLIRLRRDDLVKLCEARDLSTDGTKPQLASSLLQWRNIQSRPPPSSSGTLKPPSTARRTRRRGTKSSSLTPIPTTPVLDRAPSERVHLDEPRTPPVSVHPKESEPEVELDLESLGLVDREIPPDKLTKLEKIGSGGFKDVFIGKFKGRKVAISEFRGTLSTSESIHAFGSALSGTHVTLYSGHQRAQAPRRLQSPEHCPLCKYKSIDEYIFSDLSFACPYSLVSVSPRIPRTCRS
jgi:hypothetical protein